MAYQSASDMKNAEKYVKKMLLLKPDYHRFPNIDPIDFSQLVNKYMVFPDFYLGIKVGVNLNSIALKKSYAAYASPQSYNVTRGYQFGLSAEYRLRPSISINADFLSNGLGINHIIDSAGGYRQTYNEQQNYFLSHFSARYHLNLGKQLQLYAGAGVGFGYLLTTNVFFESTNLVTGAVQQATQDPINSRNRFQTSVNGLFGFAIPMSSGTFGVEGGFAYFFNTTVNSSKRMDDLNFIFNNQYVNDDVSLRLTMINLCYKFPFKWNVRLKK
jgi:opacity protein-like surface antigen